MPNISSHLPSFEPASGVTVNQFTAAYINSDGKLALATASIPGTGWCARAADPAAENLIEQRTTLIPYAGSSCASGISASAIAVGADVYFAAAGKIDDAGTFKCGKALTGTTAANQQIDFVITIPFFNPAAFAAA